MAKLPSATSPGPLQNPKIQNPKSPKSNIQNHQNPKSQNPQNPKSKLFLAGFWGFWIEDFASLGSNSLRDAPNAPNFGFRRRILDFGFWGFWILDFGAGIPNPKSKIQNPQNPQSKIPKIRPKKLGFWIFGILGILDCGDVGFWLLGFWGF